jgi:hypothetical protein
MSAWRQIASRYRSISWVLILGVFALTAVPAHLHYHHVIDPGTVAQDTHGLEAPGHAPPSHSHEVDYHVLAGSSPDDDHSAVHVFKTSPDVLVPKLTVDPNSVVLFLPMLPLLPFLARQTFSSPAVPPQFVYQPPDHLSPPLRAPPII